MRLPENLVEIRRAEVADVQTFEKELRLRATAQGPQFTTRIVEKLQKRLEDEFAKPLASYREEELQRMRMDFFGPNPAYHVARRRFVFKGNAPTLLAADQLAGPLDEERRSLGVALAWLNLLHGSVRLLFETA